MQSFDPQDNNPYKNRPSFQEYRVQDSDSEEEVTTRQEPSFIEETITTMEQGQQRAPTMEEQMVMLMAGMQRLLQQDTKDTTTNNFTRPKLPEPDTYHGDRSPGAVESWVRTMERYLELTSLDDHEWVPYAVMKLRDEAEEWWQQRSFLGPIVAEWIEFRKFIIEEFRPLNATQQARDKLAVLHQTGTVIDYVAQFRGVRIQIPTMTDEEALDRFTRGLQDDIRAHVVTRFPSNSEEAQRMALAYESARNIRHELLSNTTTPHQDNRTPEYLRSNGVAPMDLDVIRSRPLQQGWRNYGNQSRSRPSRTPSNMHNKQCYNCGGMGHIARLCPSQPGSSSRGAVRGRQAGDLKDQARKE